MEKPVRYPIRGAFFGCALAMTATASSINAARIAGVAALFIAHLVRLFITDTEAEKSVIYGTRRTRFTRGKG
jgi:hypothetical protein